MININNIPIYYNLGIIRKTGKPRRIPLNLNWYRNAHYMQSNNVKKLVFEWFKLNVTELPILERIGEIEYTVYRARNNRADLDNFGSVVAKFCNDALVEIGLIPDDSTKYIKRIGLVDGGIDKENPRADLKIITLK